METAELCTRAESVIGHHFHDTNLLITSLTHASVAGSRLESNERLEFLGDAVLGMVVCEELYHRFDGWLEGDLTKVKSAVVSRRICAQIGDRIGLNELLILGNGIEAHDKLPMSVRAAVLEAIIGALFLDAGLPVAREFILNAVESEIEKFAASEDMQNYKSVLQQYTQRVFSTAPSYEVLDEQGPDHAKCFEICVAIRGTRYPSAWGNSKKQAEQEAARKALDVLQSSHVAGDESGQSPPT